MKCQTRPAREFIFIFSVLTPRTAHPRSDAAESLNRADPPIDVNDDDDRRAVVGVDS